jgi:predicted amidohydrolase
VVLTTTGAVAAVYRKVHLFDAPLVGLRESRLTSPGAEPCVVCDGTPAGRLGLSVCYDLRFPELYAALRRRGGAHTLLVPSAFTVTTGRAHWELLLRARAVETQCYVVAAAQVGRHNGKRESFGRAMIVDPWGTIVAECEAGAVGVAVAEIDLALVEGTRAKMPVASHARPDLFGAAL